MHFSTRPPEWCNLQTGTYHGCSSRSLVDLMLGGFDLRLQVGWRVKVLALLPGAAALNVVHAHSDCVVVGINHGAVCRVGKATVILPTCAVTPLVFPTYLVHRIKHISLLLILFTVSHLQTQNPQLPPQPPSHTSCWCLMKQSIWSEPILITPRPSVSTGEHNRLLGVFHRIINHTAFLSIIPTSCVVVLLLRDSRGQHVCEQLGGCPPRPQCRDWMRLMGNMRLVVLQGGCGWRNHQSTHTPTRTDT